MRLPGSSRSPLWARRSPAWLERLNARVLPLQTQHVLALYGLPVLHRDPSDRALLAQALAESLTLVTQDEQMQPLFSG